MSATPETENPGSHIVGAPDLASVDAIFQDEDPDFANSMGELAKDQGLAPDNGAAVDSMDPTEVQDALAGTKQSQATLRNLRIKLLLFSFLRISITSLRKAMLRCKDALLTLVSLPMRSKISLALLVFMVIVLLGLVRLIARGVDLPGFRFPIFNSFKDVADEKFALAPDEPMEEFFSPLRITEHVVLLDRLVVNLHASDAHSQPMGVFEFYLELASKAAAIEVADRKKEADDVLQRSVESMTYEELATTEGKQKLKLIVRRDISNLLTQGRVRKVYFKSVVLKP